ncbi:YidH family protein [Nocardioides nanhaiensis]|uniref:DUF202 domain-containing protein n=1 Tax=Nocardioides nanhaiensis TaxID=1476871 RepID=A0ABP8VV00_9ACTN
MGEGTSAARTRARRPRSVYEAGTEPDYRFSLANERTYLAWIRTALALIAGGVAAEVVGLGDQEALGRVLAVVLVVLGVACAVFSGVRWARAERAMRLSQPLPGFALVAVLPLGLVLLGVVLGALLW